MKIDKKQTELFKKKLLKLRDSMASSSAHLEKDAHAAANSGMPLNHLADAGTDTFDLEFSLEQLENEEHLIYNIDQALAKIDKHTFGVCEACNKPIPLPRLQALPFAANCIGCQEEIEKSGGGQEAD